MKPHFRPSSTAFASTVILATVIYFPAIWCQKTLPYDLCGQSVQCGNIELNYPFWGIDRPAYCGQPGFQLTCQYNIPELFYESVNYRVLDVDRGRQTITIARNDLWNNVCPQYLYNTTYNSTLFNGNFFDQESMSLYFGCNFSTASLQPLESNYQFSCNVNNTKCDGLIVRTSSIVPSMFNFLGQCNNHITVHVNQSSASRFESGTSTTSDLKSALRSGFKLQWTVNNSKCNQCIKSKGRCGSSTTSPELFACYCPKGNFSLTCNTGIEREGSEEDVQEFSRKFILVTGSQNAVRSIFSNWQLVTGISCGIAGMMLLLVVVLCRRKRLHDIQKSADHQIEISLSKYGRLAPKRYKFSEIKKMTKSFLEKLGQGGYGSVYKGELPTGELVAVKLLAGAQGDGEDFINEVASIISTSHVNVVTLLGFCFEGKKRALMYEFMPNGSLDKFLHGDGSHLDWNTLFRIVKGIARGLEYLHKGCKTRIVHFDIKPHNILLDEEFVPKISDFGLAKLCKRKESIVSVTGARGTAGYMAPEVFFRSFGGASHKSDVYSYGMMVLEMTGARKNKNTANLTSGSEAYFPEWIYKQVEAGDSLGVDGVTTKEDEELARKLVTVSLWCIQSDPSDRPSISKVVEMLEGNSESLQVPPKRFWSSPTRPAQGPSPSATQSSSNDRVSEVN